MNTDAPAHAVTDDTDPRTIKIVARKAIAPSLIDHADEIRIGCLVLDFRSLVDVGFGGITEHVIEIWNNCGVAQLSKSISGGLEITGETGVLVNQQQRGSFLRLLWMGDVPFDSVLLLRQSARLNGRHRFSSCLLGLLVKLFEKALPGKLLDN